MSLKKVQLYDYVDYVEYLKDWFEYQKKTNKIFSYQYFSNKAGFKSKAFIAQIVSGKKALPRKSAYQVANAMGLSKKEKQYLYACICFKESDNLEEKNTYWDQIQDLKPASYQSLPHATFDYFQHWHISVFREVVTFFDFKEDYELLSSKVTPKVTAQEAKEAIEVLLELKFIEKKGNLYIQTDSALYAHEDMISLAVQKYQKRVFELAIRASQRYYDKNNNFKTMTLGTNADGIQAIEILMEEFQEKLIKIVETHSEVDRVFQMNLQLFPLTQID